MIPHFYLYEDDLPEIDPAFLHIERITVRSSRHDWTIRPHSHPHHHQILLISKGGGRLDVDDQSFSLGPLSLLIIPSLMVHAFAFEKDTDGYVITVSPTLLRLAADDDPEILEGFLEASHFAGARLADAAGLTAIFRSLQDEFVWSAPGRRAAIRGLVLLLAVHVSRLRGRRKLDTIPETKAVQTVTRFRAMIEQHYRMHRSLSYFADQLGISTARLNALCRSVTGQSSLQLIEHRLIIEAKRRLLYSDMNVAEIGESLGYADPGYFNRFFSKRAGLSPGQFRRNGNQRFTVATPPA